MFYKRKRETFDKGEHKFVSHKFDFTYNQSVNPKDFFILIHTGHKSLFGLNYENLIRYYTYFDSGLIREYTFFFDTEEDMVLYKLKYNL